MQPENPDTAAAGAVPAGKRGHRGRCDRIVDTRHGQVHAGSPAATKVAVFAALFGARPGDVRALR